MNLNLSIHALNLLYISQFHSVLPESLLSSIPNIGDLFHGLNSLHIHVSIVLKRLVAFLLEFKNRIIGKLFAVEFSVGFGPGEFSGVMFGFEVFVAFGSTKTEDFAVVTDEHHAVAGVDRAWTEVTFLDSHFNNDQLIYYKVNQWID